MCRPRCIFASLALVLEQICTEGLNTLRMPSNCLFVRAERAHMRVLLSDLLLN